MSYPVQSGHPCLGCSEPSFWDGGGFYQGQSAPIDRPAAAAAGTGRRGRDRRSGAALAAANAAKKRKAGKANASRQESAE